MFHDRRIDALSLGAALCATPVSIAATEVLLGIALVARAATLIRTREPLRVSSLFWFWLVWAGAEIVSWLHSPNAGSGIGEIRHLLLIAALFAVLPALDVTGFRTAVWRCILITSSFSALVLVTGFVWRMIHYRREIAAAADASVYLRSGGLLHHWMVYAVVEILVFPALLRLYSEYPEYRKWLAPACTVHGLAIVLSLTRALWLACFLVLAVHLAWRRSRWIYALPAALALIFLSAPAPVRARVVESADPAYYSNAERLEMWRVGYRMIREHPWFGVGPGRVEASFAHYVSPGEPLPAYHGHLHDNALQLAAQFGLPVLLVAMWFLWRLVRELRRAERAASDRESRFVCSTALLAMAGYLILGLTDYTYGHSLGLILGTSVILPYRRNLA